MYCHFKTLEDDMPLSCDVTVHTNSLSLWLWPLYLCILHLFSYDDDDDDDDHDDVKLGTMEKEVPMSQIWSVVFPFPTGCKKNHISCILFRHLFNVKKRMVMTKNLFWRILRLRASAIINYSLTSGNWTVFRTPRTNFHLLTIWNYWMTQNFHVSATVIPTNVMPQL